MTNNKGNEKIWTKMSNKDNETDKQQSDAGQQFIQALNYLRIVC